MPGLSSRGRTEPLLLLLLLAALLPGVPVRGQALAADLPKTWRVGFASWGGAPVGLQNEYLRFSLPLSLRDSLAGVSSREIGAAEATALADSLAARRAEALSAQLATVNRSRDELLFQDLAAGEREKALRPLDANRRQLMADLSSFEGGGPYRDLIPEEIPLAFEPADLISPPAYSPGAAARKAGVDFLVWGRLEPVEDYLYWRVGCYSVLLDREIYSHEEVSSPEEIATAVTKVVGGLAEALLARPWASLTVAPQPEGATVEVDGRGEGVAPVDLRFLEPGVHQVGVSLEGYQTRTETVFLEPSEMRRLEPALERLPTRPVTLASDPAGAMVYRDSLFVGKTPVVLDLPPDSSFTYRLVSEGYFDRYQELDAKGPDLVDVSLRRRLVETGSWQETERRRFFRSLGVFALVVPIPIVSYAFALDSAVARGNTVEGSSEYDTLTRRTTIGYGLYIGGLFVAVVLGFNVIRDLLEYIHYTDDPDF